jgi:hypothetical protein
MNRSGQSIAHLDLFRGSEAVAAGFLHRDDLRTDRVQRLFRDVYTWTGVPVTHELRTRAAALALPAGTVITGRSAATLRGAQVCWTDDPVHVVAPLELRVGRRTGVLLRRTELAPEDYAPWGPGNLASPLRMGLDLLLGRPLPESVADLDQALKAGIIDRPTLAAALRSRRDKGIRIARQAEALATGVADSHPESKVRVHLVLAGLDPVAQHWIEVEGERIAQVDLAFPKRRVAVEYDGSWRENQLWALNHDRARLNRVQSAGWRVVFVTAALLRTPRRMIAEIQAALAHPHD